MIIPVFEFDITTEINRVKVVAKAVRAYYEHKVKLLEPYLVCEVPRYIPSFAIGYYQKKLLKSSREELFRESVERVKHVYKDYKSIIENLPQWKAAFEEIHPEICAAGEKCHEFDKWRVGEEKKARHIFKNGQLSQKEYQLYLKLLKEEAARLSSNVSKMSRNFERQYFPSTRFEGINLWDLIKNDMKGPVYEI